MPSLEDITPEGSKANNQNDQRAQSEIGTINSPSLGLVKGTKAITTKENVEPYRRKWKRRARYDRGNEENHPQLVMQCKCLSHDHVEIYENEKRTRLTGVF